MKMHEVAEQHKGNVRKQAEQIAFSILQAEEYWRSASLASPATSPLLYYYGLLAMAITELLWKQSGDVSLDKARQEHAHHGLIMALKSEGSLLEKAWAEPHYLKGVRGGTFELWRRSALQAPLHVDLEKKFASEMVQKSALVYFGHTDDGAKVILPAEGMSLFRCLTMLPTMAKKMQELSLPSCLVRCNTDITYRETNFLSQKRRTHINFILQPCHRKTRDGIMEKIKLGANCLDRVDLVSSPTENDGFLLRIKPDDEDIPVRGSWPDGFPARKDETWVWPGNNELNEFGYMYVATYLTGMISRYYPDLWMKETRNNSTSLLAIESLMEHISWRAPILLLGELSGSLFLLES